MKKKHIITFTSLFLILASLFTSFCGCTKEKPDDKKEEEDEDPYMYHHNDTLEITESFDDANAVYVLDPDDASTFGTVLGINTDTVYEGSRFSGKWADQNVKTAVRLTNVPRDVTKYEVAVVRVYSEKNTGSKFQFRLLCQTSGTTQSYGGYSVTVNFTGWKDILIPLTELSNGYNPDYTKVSAIEMNSSGWSMTPDPETVLYFDSIFFASKYIEYNFDPEEIGDYNYENIMDTLVAFQTGGMDITKAEGDYLTKITSYVNAAKNSQSKMRRVENWDGSFEAEPTTPFAADMTTTAGITSNYSHILNMARGYAIEGSETYHNEKLLDDIVYALEYMHVNYYHQKDIRTYPTFNNWWEWQIGSAQNIVNILMLTRDGLTQRQIDKYLTPVNTYDPLPSMTMANRVDIAYVTLSAAALQHDYERLARTRNMLDECCIHVTSGDGFYDDGSFVQHDIIAYTGSYGPIMLEALSKQIVACADTCFRFGEYMIGSQYDWTMESFTPLMYHGAFFGLVRGRSICRTSTDVSLGLTALQGMLRMTKYVTDPEKCGMLKSIIKEYNEYNGAYYHSALAPFDLKILDEIASDENVKARTNYTFAKVFAKMDRPIAQLNKYAVGISVSSSRIAKYEAINGENGKGWYTGDGMLYVYTTVNDYDASYWKNVNYYRIPGTTVTKVERVNQNISASSTLSQYDFVGGVSLSDSMVAAMQFESATAKMSPGSTLNGKKSWFVFDNEIVCLGAGISCSDNYDTETIIENRRLASGKKFTADGEDVTGNSGALSGKKSLYIEDFGGIYLPTDAEVNFNRTSSSFLELYFTHGKNFLNKTYAYTLLPTMSQTEISAYASAPETEILSNTANVQAVRDTSTGLTGYVFWKAGTFDGVTVSAPCTLLISEGAVACADPTMKVSSITVTVGGHDYVFDGLKNGGTQTKTLVK